MCNDGLHLNDINNFILLDFQMKLCACSFFNNIHSTDPFFSNVCNQEYKKGITVTHNLSVGMYINQKYSSLMIFYLKIKYFYLHFNHLLSHFSREVSWILWPFILQLVSNLVLFPKVLYLVLFFVCDGRYGDSNLTFFCSYWSNVSVYAVWFLLA